ncbi:hypothetical protein MiTe_02208 [Microcystis aeruginosa NIES-2520]|jgi:hypothetical protein|uniref:Uncharacterized protein n=1 Tax=Microcystis aeruginosa NIES-2520 TaxID=2303982 RepID=A0A5A5RK94_MICAE|nr:DUF29 domain-containing protein [Microcystis aeruginosa]GCA75375.1 hypothetical protein MiTe_02208 [Microcystis aeruginosa NIES-2520]
MVLSKIGSHTMVPGDVLRKAKRTRKTLTETELPVLWILTPTFSATMIEEVVGIPPSFLPEEGMKEEWGKGVYLSPSLFKTVIAERERNARHWLGEIATFRVQLKKKIKTPTLKNHAINSFGEAYSDARQTLIDGRIVDKNTIPLESIFTLEQVLDGDWFPIDIAPFLTES